MKILNFSVIALAVALLLCAGWASAAGCVKGDVGGAVVGHPLAKTPAQDHAMAAKAQAQKTAAISAAI
jgi:hypothetical protein